MRRNRKMLVTGCLLALVMLLIFAYWYLIYSEEYVEEKNIALIATGGDTSQWNKLLDGANQAAKLYEDKINIELDMVSASTADDPKGQMQLLEREVAAGADGILIIPEDMDYATKYIKEQKISVPVIFLGSESESTADSGVISVNHYECGKLLAQTIVENEDPLVKVAIICNHMNREPIAASYKGVKDTLKENNIKTVDWRRNTNEEDLDTIYFLQRALVAEAVDVVVALDNETCEVISEAVNNLNKDLIIYGIANSDNSVNYMDKGTIKELVYINDFNIGYLAMQKLINPKSTIDPKYLEYRAITKDKMYSEQNEKLIFPFIK